MATHVAILSICDVFVWEMFWSMLTAKFAVFRIQPLDRLDVNFLVGAGRGKVGNPVLLPFFRGPGTLCLAHGRTSHGANLVRISSANAEFCVYCASYAGGDAIVL